MGRPSPLNWAIVTCLAVLIVVLMSRDLRSLREVWKDLTGPDWLAAIFAYGFIGTAWFLLVAFIGVRHKPIYPHSKWAPVALLGSVCLGVSGLVILFTFVGTSARKRLRRRKAHEALQKRGSQQ